MKWFGWKNGSPGDMNMAQGCDEYSDTPVLARLTTTRVRFLVHVYEYPPVSLGVYIEYLITRLCTIFTRDAA